ncbi:MAG TPA: hypothetical protein VHQ95_24005 [Pyrinomonadaceae bacterium]|nr:hypothetical protein [Pyrinomonadaceae bacterium]
MRSGDIVHYRVEKFAIADVYGDIEGRRAFISLPPKVPLRSRALRFHRGMLGDGLGALEPFRISHNDIDKSAWLSPS